MNTPTGQSVSLWMRTAKAPEFPALSADFRADVCVVGAGIAGLSTAYLLAREGKSVVVLDDGPIGSGQTRRTTAHLSNAIDDRYVEIERVHGAEGAKLAAASHSAAIDRIASNVEDEAIDCDFTRLDGYLFCPPDEKSDLLERECDAARRAGLKRVEVVDRAPIPEFDTGPALRFPKQGMFDPMKYLAGLVKAFRRYRGEIFTGTHAAAVADGSPAKVMTANGSVVTCDAVVVATNAPVNDRVALHTKQAPYITFAIALPVPRGSVTKALYWDTPDPYHYVRLQGGDDPGEDLLIVGGEDHKTGQDGDGDAARYARLELWARRRWPQCGPPAYRWSGQVMESDDGLAFIGRNPGDEHVYTATGDSGMGMTHGTIAGILLTDLILGRENPWATLYDPSRKHVWGMAGKEFVKENLNVAKQYLDWVTGGDVKSADQIAPGEGAVLRRGLHKVAVYRDKSGALTELSATCPHLGCVVHWNGGEKTWDCPCHGSRFDARGLVINGPANRNLAPAAGDDGAERKGAAERTTAP